MLAAVQDDLTVNPRQNAGCCSEPENAPDFRCCVANALRGLEGNISARNLTVLFSPPPERTEVGAEPNALYSAMSRFLGAAFAREDAGQRVELIVWRSLSDVRMAMVTLARPDGATHLRMAEGVDGEYFAALAGLESLGCYATLSTSPLARHLLLILPAHTRAD
ncbi:MAG: hypothetical protein KGL46_02125 [Hyphomicrobiales bacterium]|nr:hypothetical protein [Hyphomicrobiales bacterium]